jgi:thiol-disulfide isomerase/thioredoxin
MSLIGAGLLLIGFVSLFSLLKTFPSRSEVIANGVVPVDVNFPAPDLVLQDLKGSPVSLADYRGKTVLVNNWATWCPPCRAEMPTLQSYYQDHRHQDFILVAIESGDPVEQVVEFANQLNLSFPIWIDLEMKAIQEFRNQALPNSYLIDKFGTVILAWSGATSRDNLEKYITPLLEN